MKAAKLASALLLAPFLLEGAYRLALPSAPYDVYAIGESTTLGEPYPPRLAFPVQAAAMLGPDVTVLNLARAGDSIYPQALALARRLKFRRGGRPAVVFIYSGHNEHFTEPRPVGVFTRAYLRIRNALLDRSFLASDLIVALERRLGARGPRTLADYERHLRRALEASLAAGAKPVLAVPVSNLSGIEPTLACPESEKYALIARARLGRFDAPCLAPLADYRRGKIAEKRGDKAAAKRLFLKARDEDPHNGFGRVNSEQETLLRRLAAEYKIPLVDAPAMFAAAPGELMSDGHHPSIEGHLLLARAFAQAVSSAPVATPTPAAVFAREKIGPVDQASAWNYTGRWLLTVSVRHPAADERLALAKRAFERALTFVPGDAQGSAGLALTARGPLSLYDPAVIAEIEALGRSPVARKKPASRREELEALLEDERRLPAVADQLRLAARFRALGDARHADSMLVPLRRRFGWTSRSLADLAEAALAERDFDAALSALYLAETAEPSAKTRVAALYARLIDADEETRKRVAVQVAAAAAPRGPEPGEQKEWIDKAELSARNGDAAAARAALARAEAPPLSDDARLRLSGVYRLLRDAAGAQTHLDRIKTKTDDLLLESAEVSLLRGRKAEALAFLSHAGPSMRLARSYQSIGDYGAGATVLDVLIAKSPNAELYGDRGLCRHLAGRSDAAVEDLKRALALDADFLPAYLTLGAVYESRGKAADAIAVYEKGLARPATPAGESLRGVLLKSRDEARRKR